MLRFFEQEALDCLLLVHGLEDSYGQLIGWSDIKCEIEIEIVLWKILSLIWPLLLYSDST